MWSYFFFFKKNKKKQNDCGMIFVSVRNQGRKGFLSILLALPDTLVTESCLK